MKEKNKQYFSLNMKKNIVLSVCSLVLVGAMGSSLWKQTPKELVVQEKGTATDFVGKNMEQTSTATNLYMNYAEVEREDAVSGKEQDENVDVMKEMLDDEADKEMSKGPDASKSGLVSSDDNTKDGSIREKASKSSSIIYQEISDSTTKSGPKKSGKSKNRVVSDVSRMGESQGNRVVENPEPLNYIEKIFANHGIAPVIEEVLRKYQYPVEIGYSYDKNYDGNNEAGDFILNRVFDTEDYDEESTEKETVGDDSIKTEDSENIEEDTQQEEALDNEVSGDAVVEQEMASGDVQESAVSGDAVSDEQEKLEEYRKDIWKQIMPTEPIDVEIEKKVMKTIPVEKSKVEESSITEQETETTTEQASEEKEATTEVEVQASGDAEEMVEPTTEAISQEDNSQTTPGTIDGAEDMVEQMTEGTASGDATSIMETEAVAGYYIIKGKMREGSNVYVSDIEILPVGVDGFDQIRIGEDGEFKDSIVLTEDVVNREIELYFTDGETVTEATTFTYSKDTITPELQWLEDQYTLLESAERKIYCTKEDKLPVKVFDGEGNEGETLERIRYLYGTKLQSLEEGLDDPELAVSEDFYGRLLISCHDKAGNVSDIQSQFVLIDHNAPVIQLAQDERCSAPYSLWVNVEEIGHIVSGIQTIRCVVDGNIYEIGESMVRETYTLDEGLEVSSKLTFPIELTEVGIHAISILVRDYAGNETVVEQTIEVTEPELVSIYMPRNFTIHIDPQQLAGKEQIYSDNVEFKNVSKFDVRVNIDNIVLNVNDEVSTDGVLKDCEIYLIAPDTGEKIKLSKGENEDVYSYCLPVDAVGDLANIRFVGTTTEGSAGMWKGSDISLSLQVSFIKWEVEEPG